MADDAPLTTASAPPKIPLYESIAGARGDGYSWDEINQHLGQSRQAAKSNGYSDDEINKFLGFKDPAEMQSKVKDYVRSTTRMKDRPTVQATVRAAVKGFGEGYGDEPLYQLSDTEIDRAFAFVPFVGRLFGGATGAIGAVAEKVAQAFGANPTQAEQIKQGSKQMLDSFLMDAGSRVAPHPSGLPLPPGVRADGLPPTLAQLYHEGLNDGSIQGPEQMGRLAAREVLKTKEPGPDGEYSETDIASAAAMGQYIAAKFPGIQELTDHAITIASYIGGKAPDIGQIRFNLSRWWAETGESVAAAAQRAQTDPIFRAKLAVANEPPPAPASAGVPTPHGEFTVSRTPSDFDHSIGTILKLEGGLTTDTGGLTKFGISANAHPGVDVANLTRDQAVEIYKHDYWDAIRADDLPENVRLSAFDAAVNEGVGKAREMLLAAGNDAEKFQELRREHYTKLAQDPKYAPYYKSWMHRLDATRAGAGEYEGHLPPDTSEPAPPAGHGFSGFNSGSLEDRTSSFDTERFNLRDDYTGDLKPEMKPLDDALNATISEKFDPERVTDAAKWATENDRGDIQQALLDRAQNALEEAREKVDAFPPEIEVKSAAVMDAQKLAFEREKTVDQLAKLTGREPSPAAIRRIPPPEVLGEVTKPPEVEEALREGGTYKPNPRRVTLARTGIPAVDRVLDSQITSRVIEHAVVNRDHSIPYVAGGSEPLENPTVYIDKNTPKTLTTKSGKTFKTDDPLIIHENVEQHVMEALIKQGWSHDDAYKVAHWHFAEAAEHAWYSAKGVDPAEAEEAWKPVIEKAVAQKATSIPHNLYEDPYPHDDPHLAGGASDAEARPSPKLIAKAEADLAKDSTFQQAVPGATGRSRRGAGQNTGANPMGPSANPRADLLSHFADADKGPGLFERLVEMAYKGYLQFFNPAHPINKLTDIVNNARQGAGMSPLNGADNPTFMRRAADVMPVTHATYMIEKGMVGLKRDATGKPTGAWKETGPGLKQILKFKNKQEYGDFLAYALAKWAIEKSEQGLETGVNLANARAWVQQMEVGAGKVLGLTPERMADLAGDHRGIAGPVKTHVEDTGNIGPHYMPSSHSVHMDDPAKVDYKQTYGADFDTILAHELGHAIAYKIGVPKGIPALKMSELADQLAIASHRFKPGLWKRYRKDTSHFTQDSELIADALATWARDPGARVKLSALRDILGEKLDPYGKVPKPEDIGTPVSRRFDQLVDWQNGTFKYLRDTGVISNDTFVKSVADNSSRIPGYRLMEDQAAKGVGGPGKTAYNPITQFKGSGLKVKNLFESLMKDAFLRTKLGQDNLANQTLVNAAMQVKGLVERVPDVTKPFELTWEEMKKLADPKLLKDRTPIDDNFVIWRTIGQQARHDEVPVLEDGKVARYKFEDEHIAPFLKGLNEGQTSVWAKILSKFSGVTRSLIVLNPLFPAKLIMYDVPWQFITKPELRSTITDVAVGVGEFFAKSEDYHKWLRSAGAERVFQGLHGNEYIKEQLRGQEDGAGKHVWNAVTSPFHALRAWAQMLSQFQRLGRFKRGLAAGESELEAGVASGEAAFHRAGFGGGATRAMNSLQPFLAAHLNSLEQTFRGQLGIGKTATGKAYDPVAFSAKALAAITLPIMWNWSANKDDARYRALPDWQKDNGLNFWPGGQHLYIPLPPLISFIYGGVPRRLAEAYVQDNPHAKDGIAGSLAASLLPPGFGLASNFATPVIEQIANKSFFRNQPLVSPHEQDNVLPQYQTTPYSSATAKALSRGISDLPLVSGLKLSPAVIDNYIQGWGGSLGQAAVRGGEELLKRAGILPPNPLGDKVSDWPLINSFLTRNPGMSAQPIKDFIGRMDIYRQTHGSLLKLMKEGDLPEFQKLIAGAPGEAAMHAFHISKGEGGVLAASGTNIAPYSDALARGRQGADMQSVATILQIDKALTNARQTAADIAANKQLSPEQRSQELDKLYAMAQMFAERGIKALDKAGFK